MPEARPGERTEHSERGQQRRRGAAAAPAREPQKRHSLGPLPILLGIFAGLALCALAYVALILFLRQTPSAPSGQGINGSLPAGASTAADICNDLTRQQYDQLYTLLAPSLQAQGAEAQFAASQRELDRLLGPVRACLASSPTPQAGSGATQVTLRLQRGQSAATSATITLIQSGSAWRISSYSQNV